MSVILDGKQLATERRNQVKDRVEILIEKYHVRPQLVVILIGHDMASETYVSGKEKACRKAGIESRVIRLEESVSENKVMELISSLNQDKSVHGILLQLPIPKQLDPDKLMAAISPEKDVDGFAPTNVWRLASGHPELVPCTPLGIMHILEKYEIGVEGKQCVIIGRSQIVGKPMAQLLLNANGTVTICHSKTRNLPSVAKTADILVVAIGKPKLVDDTYIKEGATVIDVGISRTEGKLVGDVDFEKAVQKAGYITPVPGGVGPMTIACLLENTISCYQKLVGE
ncbi:MAG: bifunctional methylenetetrahydrofolate dehydrogenase/methenyltetrahydrofolate cyclohydrolase FolD [Candidatus Izemoplasmatales bacterium]|nr:bifunctional methylenetetrahydrofolate dehydrogenase/methenyltetrahydrofolate cyclohydrolase FolD [Candidatus Izemoplasmatales bacterium]